MSEVVGYTISSWNGVQRKFLDRDSQSGYPYLSSVGIHQTFDTQDEAESWLVKNYSYVNTDGQPEVVEIRVNVVSTLSTIDRNQVIKKAALAKLTDEERKVLGF